MYYNKEHEEKVNSRGDGYIYIGSYHSKEYTIDGKYSKSLSYIRVKCPYCGKEYDITLGGFINNKYKCNNCCHSYENSFAYYIQVVLQETLNKYWDWNKNNENPYCISKQSHKKFWIKCDKKDYHNSYLITLYHFFKGNRCPYCSAHKVHPRDSFGQWLINEFGDDAIKKYWSPKNVIDPFSIAPQSNKKVWLYCQNYKYHNDFGGYEVTCANFYNGNRCSYCSSNKIHPKDSFGQWLIDKFGKNAIKIYWSSKNKISPFEIAPKSAKKVWIYCQDKDYHNDDGGYLVTPSHFLMGNRCSYCSTHHGKVHKKDSFGFKYPNKAKYWSKNNNKSPFEVTTYSNYKYKFICEKCGREFERSLDSLNQNDTGVVCVSCQSSKLEQNTKVILDKYNIEYKTQVTYEDLIGLKGGLLSYDFYLPKYNILLECQGIQHEKFTKGLHESKKDFLKQLEHDRRKFEYAMKNNYIPMEIWYWNIDNIEEILIRELGLS